MPGNLLQCATLFDNIVRGDPRGRNGSKKKITKQKGKRERPPAATMLAATMTLQAG